MTEKILKNHIGYWVNQLRAQVHESFELKLKKFGITVAQWCVLVSVYDGSACSVRDLTYYIGVDKASISRVVERLVKQGLIMHRQGQDRRSGCVELTHAGLNLVPKLINEAENNEKEFFGCLTLEELQNFKHVLHTLIKNSSSISLEGWIKG